MPKAKNDRYYICKNGNETEIIYIDYDKLKGFDFNPKNKVKYDGIIVNKMAIIKPSMIEKVLKRKIKRKLDLYLKLIIRFIESDDSDSGDVLREALNDLTRYKSIIQHKYKKYLDEKYLSILLKKIAILDYDVLMKCYLEKEEDQLGNSKKLFSLNLTLHR